MDQRNFISQENKRRREEQENQEEMLSAAEASEVPPDPNQPKESKIPGLLLGDSQHLSGEEVKKEVLPIQVDDSRGYRLKSDRVFQAQESQAKKSLLAQYDAQRLKLLAQADQLEAALKKEKNKENEKKLVEVKQELWVLRGFLFY